MCARRRLEAEGLALGGFAYSALLEVTASLTRAPYGATGRAGRPARIGQTSYDWTCDLGHNRNYSESLSSKCQGTKINTLRRSDLEKAEGLMTIMVQVSPLGWKEHVNGI